MSASRQKLRASNRLANKEQIEFTEKQKRQMQHKYTHIVSAKLLVDNYQQAHTERTNILLGILDECFDVYTKKKEPAHISVAATNAFFMNYHEWSHLLSGGHNMISQLLWPNLEILAHEARMWYEFTKASESLKMNKQQLRKWRTNVTKKFGNLGYSDVFKGYKGIYS